jgi:hypothetical protein
VSTGKRSLASVDLQMHLQLVLVGEPRLTLRAAVGFLPCVDPLVPLLVKGVGEIDLAHLVAERVYLLVNLHLFGETKGFPIERTRVASVLLSLVIRLV